MIPREPLWMRERREWVERERPNLGLMTMQEQLAELDRLAAQRTGSEESQR